MYYAAFICATCSLTITFVFVDFYCSLRALSLLNLAEVGWDMAVLALLELPPVRGSRGCS